MVTEVNFEVPAMACDCHTHIFADPHRFPLWPARAYTPEMALPEEMAELHRELRLQRVVIVTPSVYGTDNSATLYGIQSRGPDARGVAVIDEKTPERDLDAMEEAGIRGARLNFKTIGLNDPVVCRRQFLVAVDRLKSRPWHIQMLATLRVISSIQDLVRNSPMPVVFDHFAGIQATAGLEQPEFADLLELVRSGNAYVKISGAYRVSNQNPNYMDVASFVRALVAANADRIIWGTDWPHPDAAARPGRRATDVAPLLPIDDGHLLNQLAVWVGDPVVRKKILVDNPARLYGF